MYKRILVPLDGSAPDGEVFTSIQESEELYTIRTFSLIPDGSMLGPFWRSHAVHFQNVCDFAANMKSDHLCLELVYGGSYLRIRQTNQRRKTCLLQ